MVDYETWSRLYFDYDQIWLERMLNRSERDVLRNVGASGIAVFGLVGFRCAADTCAAREEDTEAGASLMRWKKECLSDGPD